MRLTHIARDMLTHIARDMLTRIARDMLTIGSHIAITG